MISKQIEEEIKKHAFEDFPRESCGIVTKDDKYVRLPNKALDQSEGFDVGGGDYDSLYKNENISIFVHSHPNGPSYPSGEDMAGQIRTGFAFCIIPVYAVRGSEEKQVLKTDGLFYWGGHTPIPDLLGRRFRHGVTDCYSLIRDFYKLELEVTLPEYARNWGWWEGQDNNDMYNDLFEKAGCHEIHCSDVKKGDIFLAAAGTRQTNHGGVYLGNGLILHHKGGRNGFEPTRVSARESVGRWMDPKYLRKWVRHSSQD